jgi:hypothetical protein
MLNQTKSERENQAFNYNLRGQLYQVIFLTTCTLKDWSPFDSLLNPTACTKSVNVVDGLAIRLGYGSGPRKRLDCMNTAGGEYTLILSVLGSRCLGGVTGFVCTGSSDAVGSGGTSLSSPGTPVENRLRTREPERFSIERMDRELIDERLSVGFRRRKSVR